MNAYSPDPIALQLVLRVLDGRQAGAEYRLGKGMAVSIGHAFGHDIVLRAPSTRGISLQIETDGAVPLLRVMQGEVNMLARPVVGGECAQLPLYVPVAMGELNFAIGDPASDRWQEASALSDAPVQMSAEAVGNGEQQVEISIPAVGATTDLQRKLNGGLQFFQQRFRPVGDAVAMERRWPIYAIIMATLLLALLLYGPTYRLVGDNFGGPVAAQKMLKDEGFADVAVSENPDGSLLVKGLVRNDAQLVKIRNLVADRLSGAVIDVNTMDGVAAGITDMLAAQGIDAEARPGRGRTLVIDSEYLPGDRQDEIAAQIRKDVPVLQRIMFTINPDRGEPVLQYFFASDTYGIASFVDGDPAYIATADGTKWFKGAAVPTGHVITDIGNGRVRFEREGKIEELSFGASDAEQAAADAALVDEKVGEEQSRTGT
jgi:type III secretion protein D